MEYITPRNHIYAEGNILLYDLQLANVPESYEIGGEVLPRQPEFHITLVDGQELSQLIAPDDIASVQARIRELFIAYESTHHVDQYSFTNRHFVIDKSPRKSLVVECAVPHLDGFFDVLEQEFGVSLPWQWPHVTLFARENEGIGVWSREVLDECGREVMVSFSLVD